MALANLNDILERVYVEGGRQFNEGYGALLADPGEFTSFTSVFRTNAKRLDLPFIKDFPKLELLSDVGGAIPYSDLSADTYSITPKEFGTGIKMKEADVDDDTLNLIMGRINDFMGAARIEMSRRAFDCLKSGTATTTYGACYDGKALFATDHPVGSSTDSNYSSGGGATAWYVLDCSKPYNPIVMAVRKDPEWSFFDQNSDHFKDKREFKWNIYCRFWPGYGMWQQAFCSTQSFSEDNLWQVIEDMREMKDDEGRSLGIRPTHLLVAPDTEQAARNILERSRLQGTAAAPSNEPTQALRLQLVVSDYLT